MMSRKSDGANPRGVHLELDSMNNFNKDGKSEGRSLENVI